MDLKEYDKALSEFDWSYELSDEHSVWQRGVQRMRELRELAMLSPDHELLFDSWADAQDKFVAVFRAEKAKEELEQVRKQLGVI